MRKVLGLIDQHISAEGEGRIAVRQIAREVGLSYFHFSRAFKRALGISPNDYIAEKRIEHAKKLITETNPAISEIALPSGFSSQSHFTTSFRRLTGLTPTSFKKGI
jgi:AraC family transcriptional regulator